MMWIIQSSDASHHNAFHMKGVDRESSAAQDTYPISVLNTGPDDEGKQGERAR